jgi:Pyridine nucleotide-disulphide oxidoreductase
MSGTAENTYDVIVIGAGPVGYTLVGRARAAGLSVAAVERELVGGECSYWACIPSKAMLRRRQSAAGRAGEAVPDAAGARRRDPGAGALLLAVVCAGFRHVPDQREAGAARRGERLAEPAPGGAGLAGVRQKAS